MAPSPKIEAGDSARCSRLSLSLLDNLYEPHVDVLPAAGLVAVDGEDVSAKFRGGESLPEHLVVD